MYDVLYLDQGHHHRLIAAGLGRESAVDVARAEARRRHVGRMFLAGSDPAPQRDLVVIVQSERKAA